MESLLCQNPLPALMPLPTTLNSAFLQAIPRGGRYAWLGCASPSGFLLLVAVLGIFEWLPEPAGIWSAFALRHHAALNQALGLELQRPPTDSTFAICSLQVMWPEILPAAAGVGCSPRPRCAMGSLISSCATARHSAARIVQTTVAAVERSFLQVTPLLQDPLGCAAIARPTYDTR